MGRTCEKYARRVNDYYILESFYSNRELTDKMYTQKEYDEISRDELINIINIHNKCHNTLSEENIQKLILEDFFFAYMPFCEDSTQFYGQAVCNLTHHQIKLIVYSRVFKSIFLKNMIKSQNISKKIPVPYWILQILQIKIKMTCPSTKTREEQLQFLEQRKKIMNIWE